MDIKANCSVGRLGRRGGYLNHLSSLLRVNWSDSPPHGKSIWGVAGGKLYNLHVPAARAVNVLSGTMGTWQD